MVDENPFEGTSYYRLKQTDYNGVFKYSPIVEVTEKHTKRNSISNLYPNPTANNVEILYNTDTNATLLIQVLDNMGRIMFTETQMVFAGTEKIKVSTNSLLAGIYAIKITVAETGVISMGKIIKQ